MAANLLVLLSWWRYYVVINRRREAAFKLSGMGAEQREHESRVAGETDQTDIEVGRGVGWRADSRTGTSGTLASVDLVAVCMWVRGMGRGVSAWALVTSRQRCRGTRSDETGPSRVYGTATLRRRRPSVW